MSQLSAFAIQATSVNLTVGTTSSAVIADTNGNRTQYRIANLGSNTVYFTYGPPGTTPTASLTTSVAMLGGTVEVFTLPANAVIAAIAAATGNTLNITPGEGL